MDNNWLNGHQVPIIDRGGISGNPGSTFVQKNEELQGSMGSQGNPSEEDIPIRKSELVEIPTASARVIYRTQAMFPFDLFPDELVIDEVKVSVIYKYFISSETNNILIKDVTDVILDTALFFGSLRISGGEYEEINNNNLSQKGPLVIDKLRVQDARIARQVIMGLTILIDQKIDTSRMSVEEIFQKTSELGSAR